MIEKAILQRRIALALKASKENPIDLDVAELAEALSVDIDVAVSQIVQAHEWDFAVAWDVLPCTADEDEYTLKGRDQQCWKVFEITYGTGSDYDAYETLTKKWPQDLAEHLTTHIVTRVLYWVPVGRDGQFPKVRIVSTPGSSDYNLRYGYWRRSVGYNELPSEMFLAPIIMGVKHLWGMASEREFAASIERVIAEYDRPASPEDNLVTLDPDLLARNRARNQKFGYQGAGSDYTVVSSDEV